MPNFVHETAIVDPQATLGKNIKIGPYCVVGPHVVIGDNTELQSHVVIQGHTVIGEDNKIFPFASIGQIPQDLKYNGEQTSLIIGNRNVIRESVTMSIGTVGGGGKTILGDDNLLMGLVHLGHDSIVGNKCVLAQGATLAGHVEVEDNVVIGGMSAVHQFVRIGQHAMIGGMTPVIRDVLPYTTAAGGRGAISSLNLIGLRRRGFSRASISVLRQAFDYVIETHEGTFESRMSKMLAEHPESVELKIWHDFSVKSKRGISTRVQGE